MSGRAVAQRRPRVSKLGLKRPSDWHSNEIAVEVARQGASGSKLKSYYNGKLLKKRAGQ